MSRVRGWDSRPQEQLMPMRELLKFCCEGHEKWIVAGEGFGVRGGLSF